jgi:hypothetical protein
MDSQTYEVIAANRTYKVTQEQIDACSRVVDLNTKQAFYQVESATTPGKIYEVRFNRTFGRLTCTCAAGIYYSTCWHRRAAYAAEDLYKEAKRAEKEAAKRIVAEIEASAQYRQEIAQVTTEQATRSYREALKEAATGGDEAAKRELKAIKRYGAKAYDSEDFNLLK